jgi:hypothetical protein
MSDVERTFPLLMTSAGNRLAVHALARCSSELVRLARHYGGDVDDVLAVRYIIACQSLFYPAIQTCVVRSFLIALALQMRERAAWKYAAGN